MGKAARDMLFKVMSVEEKENKKLIQLSGDDPLYIALGIACLFLAYASSGGVTLK